MRDDDHTPMQVETQKDVDMALEVVWISEKERTEIKERVFVGCVLDYFDPYYALDCLCQTISHGLKLSSHVVKM